MLIVVIFNKIYQIVTPLKGKNILTFSSVDSNSIIKNSIYVAVLLLLCSE